MPLKLNVGLSKKIGLPDYGSLGASVNLELELDSGAIGDPDRLRQQIRHLFGLAKSSVDEELSQSHAPLRHNTNGNGHAANSPSNGNGHSHSTTGHAHNENGQPSRLPANGRVATNSQIRAIRAISQRRRLDLGQLLSNRFRLQRPEDLSLADASALIDELKNTTPVNGGDR